MEHILLPALDDQGREKTREMLEVDRIGEGRFRLQHSPAFVDGIAGGDVIALADDIATGFHVIQRGGNLAVVAVFPAAELRDGPAGAELRTSVQTLEGTCDGGPTRVLVFTIPQGSGFSRIEAVFERARSTIPGFAWWFGNVYDPKDPTKTLDWWAGA